MSRRSGQNGHVEKKGNAYHARFWLDVPGESKRVNKSVRICPVNGPGSLNRFELKRRVKEIIAEFGANSTAVARDAEAVNLGTTFKERSVAWLEQARTRLRNPIKPRTADSWSGYLKYINQHLGEMPLCEVNNKSVREFIARMAAERKNDLPRFAAKSINNYVQVVKMVVASAVDDDGEEIYPVKWKNDFMDLPEVRGQRTPCFSAAEVEAIVAKASGQYALLYAFLAGSGLRIEEAFALQVEDVRDSVIRVRHSLWQGRLYSPKTEAGKREVDLHSSLAERLQEHLGKRRSGFVFQTSAGTPFGRSNVLRRSLHVILTATGKAKCGFHAFRRYRITHLRKLRVPEDLIQFWVGHAPASITDGYSRLKEDTEFRQLIAEQAGLGYKLPDLVVLVAPKTVGAALALTA
jgi:integrase